MSKLSDLKAAASLADKIEGALAKLKIAQENLDLLNKHRPDLKYTNVWDHGWTVELMLKKGDGGWGNHDRTVKVRVPFGVAQQQLVYAVEAARREVLALGGDLP